MKFEIKNRVTGAVQVTADIECDEAASFSFKLGLAVKWAIKAYADLTDAVLVGADLRGADLRGANLMGADLGGAILTCADLGGAVLTRAFLTGASLAGANLVNANLRYADLRYDNLAGANLTRVVLRDANLTGADLRYVNLTCADLTGANLTGADLRGANLGGADLTRANLTCADLTSFDIPIVENIDAAILAAIEANKKTGKNGLRMSHWHGADCNETNWCGTTHCRSGYAICVAGAAGFALERKVGAAAAGALIYAKSRPGKPVPNFYTNDEDAMADIKACAAEQVAASHSA